MRTHMREQNYLDRAKLNPARAFKTPMDVVETDDIDPAAKLAILKAWEADERALLRRRRRDGWRRACASSEGASGPRPTWQGALLGRRNRADGRVVLSIGRLLGAGWAKKVISGAQHVGVHRIRLSAQHFRQRCAARPHA